MKAIFKKELRDLLPWIVVGTILIAAFCWYSKGNRTSNYGVPAIDLAKLMIIGFSMVAMAFGFLQSIGDMRTEAKGYLLHRPVSVKSIFWGKLLAGAVGYSVAIIVPMIGLAIYQQVMGPEILPTSPMKLVPSMLMSIVAFSFHPAAMWAVSRQARWIGTKAIPLAVAMLGCYFAFIPFSFAYLPKEDFGLCWATILLVGPVTLVIVTGAARIAFCESQFSPPARSGHSFIRFDNLGILAVCVPAAVFITFMGLSFFETGGAYPYTQHELALTKDGQLWDVAQTTLSPEDYWNSEVSVKKIAADLQETPNDFQPLPADWNECTKAPLRTSNRRPVWKPEFAYLTQFEFSNQNYWTIYERDNRLLAYSGKLNTVLTPNGFYDSIDDAEGAFVSPSLAVNSGTFTDRKSQFKNIGISDSYSLIFDRNGVYQVNWQARTIRQILEQPNDSIAVVLPRSKQDSVFWVRSGSSVTRYLIEPLDEEVPLELTDSELIERVHSFRFPDIKTTKTDRWSFPFGEDGKPQLVSKESAITVAETGDGTTMFYTGSYNLTGAWAKYEIKDIDGTTTQSGKAVFPSARTDEMALSGLIVPPAFAATATAVMPKEGVWAFLSFFVGLSLLHGLVFAAIAFWLSRYYQLPSFSRNVWLLAAVLFGAGAPLAMWVIYPKLIRERCHHCEAMRRIDRSRCQQCGADWARPEADGNEIFGAVSGRPQAANVS